MCGQFSLCEAWLQTQTEPSHCYDKSRCTLFTIFCFGTSQRAYNNVFRTDEAGFYFHLHLHAIYVLIRLGPFPSHFNPFSLTYRPLQNLHFICQTNFTVLSTARKCFASLFTNPVSHDRKLAVEIRNTERTQICVLLFDHGHDHYQYLKKKTRT